MVKSRSKSTEEIQQAKKVCDCVTALSQFWFSFFSFFFFWTGNMRNWSLTGKFNVPAVNINLIIDIDGWSTVTENDMQYLRKCEGENYSASVKGGRYQASFVKTVSVIKNKKKTD